MDALVLQGQSLVSLYVFVKQKPQHGTMALGVSNVDPQCVKPGAKSDNPCVMPLARVKDVSKSHHASTSL